MWNFLSLLACDTINSQFKSPEELLIDVRFEQKESLEQLYSSYGGGSIANNLIKEDTSASKSNKDPNIQGFLNNIKNTIQSTDREVFVEHCLQIGQGQSVSFVTDKAKDFFELPNTINTCKSAALRQIKITKLEQTLSTPQ